MEIGVKDQPLVEQRVFARKRLLDLDDHVGLCPDCRRVVQQRGARVPVFTVGKAGAETGARFEQYRVPGGHIGFDVVGGQTDPEFIVFDFFDTANDHGNTTFQK